MDVFTKMDGSVQRAVTGGKLPNGEILTTKRRDADLYVKRDGILYKFPKRDKCLCNLVPYSFLKNDKWKDASLWLPENPNLRFGQTNFNGLSENMVITETITLGNSGNVPNLTFWWNKGLTFFTCKSNTERMNVNNFTIYFRGNAKFTSSDCTLLRMILIKVNRLEAGNIIIGSDNGGKLSVYITKGTNPGDPREYLYQDKTLTIASNPDIALSVKGTKYFIYLNGKIVKRGTIETDISTLTSCGFGVGQKIPVNSGSNSEVRINNLTVWDEALTEEELFDFSRFNGRLYNNTIDLPETQRIMRLDLESYRSRSLPVCNGVTSEYKPRCLIDTDDPNVSAGNTPTSLFDNIYNGADITNRWYNIHHNYITFPRFRPNGGTTQDGNNGNGIRFKKNGAVYHLDEGDGVTATIGFSILDNIQAGSCLLGFSPGDNPKNPLDNLIRIHVDDNADDPTNKYNVSIRGDEKFHTINYGNNIVGLPKNTYTIMAIAINAQGEIRFNCYIPSTGYKYSTDLGGINSKQFRGSGIKNVMFNFRTNWRTVVNSATKSFTLRLYRMSVFNVGLDTFEVGKLFTEFVDSSITNPDKDMKLIWMTNKELKEAEMSHPNDYEVEFRPRMLLSSTGTIQDGNAPLDLFKVIANVDEIRTTRYLNTDIGFVFLPKYRQEQSKGQNRPGFKLMKYGAFVPMECYDAITISISCSIANTNEWFSLFGLGTADDLISKLGTRYLRIEPANNKFNMYCEDVTTAVDGGNAISNKPGNNVKFNVTITVNDKGEVRYYFNGNRVGNVRIKYKSGKFAFEGSKFLAFNEWKDAKKVSTGPNFSSDMKIYGLAAYGRCLSDDEVKNLNDKMNEVYVPILPDPEYDPNIPTAYKLLQTDMRGTTMPTFGNLSVEFMPRLKPVKPSDTGFDSPKPLLINTYDDESGYGHIISTESPSDSAVRFLFSMKDRRGFGFRLMENGVFKPLDSYDGVTICVNRNIVNKPEAVLLGFVTGDDGRLSAYLTLERDKIVYNGGALAQHHDIISEIGQGRYGISIAPDGRVFVYFYGPDSGQLIRKECSKLPINTFKGCGIKGFIVCGCNNFLGNNPTPDGYGDVWFKGFTLDPQFLPKYVVEQRLNELNV